MFSFFKNKNIDHNNDEDIFSKVASLLIHIKRLGVSVKEKTPHQDKGEALNLTFCAPNPEAGGRTTTGPDKLTIVLR